MADCINDIVSLGICSDEISLSGYSLMKAPGISPRNAQDIATEQYTSATKWLQEALKPNAINAVRSDFLGYLQQINMVSTLTNRRYDSARFNTSKLLDVYAGFRGQTIRAVTKHYRGNMRRLLIHQVQSYPLASGPGTIVIVDNENGVQTTQSYNVEFVANALNTHELPIPYVAKSTQVSVLIDNTNIAFCSTDILCKTGCNGEAPNECGVVEGWDGTGYVKKEGHGINVVFSCECDYDTIICDLKYYAMGELIWLKMQELFYEEQWKSNRFDAWVVFNTKQIEEAILPDLRNRYAQKFQNAIGAGIFDILKKYKDTCINCRGVRKVVNI